MTRRCTKSIYNIKNKTKKNKTKNKYTKRKRKTTQINKKILNKKGLNKKGLNKKGGTKKTKKRPPSIENSPTSNKIQLTNMGIVNMSSRDKHPEINVITINNEKTLFSDIYKVERPEQATILFHKINNLLTSYLASSETIGFSFPQLIIKKKILSNAYNKYMGLPIIIPYDELEEDDITAIENNIDDAGDLDSAIDAIMQEDNIIPAAVILSQLNQGGEEEEI